MYDVKTCLAIHHYLNVCNLCLGLRYFHCDFVIIIRCEKVISYLSLMYGIQLFPKTLVEKILNSTC
jgi:hypothetical protein